MAKLYVTEFTNQGQDRQANFMSITLEPPLVDQTPVVIGAGHLESAAFNAETTYVRIHCDVVCSIAFGTAPVATANNRRMAANATEYFSVPKGQSFKVSVITNT